MESRQIPRPYKTHRVIKHAQNVKRNANINIIALIAKALEYQKFEAQSTQKPSPKPKIKPKPAPRFKPKPAPRFEPKPAPRLEPKPKP